jgi:hypothetical protein
VSWHEEGRQLRDTGQCRGMGNVGSVGTLASVMAWGRSAATLVSVVTWGGSAGTLANVVAWEAEGAQGH